MASSRIARVLAAGVTVFVVSAAASAAAAPGAAAQRNPAGAPNAVQWRLDQVGREDPRSLDLVAYGSSCLDGRTTVQADETATTIRIRVTADIGGVPCTADYRPHPLTVALDRPIAGRPIRGPLQLATGRDPLPDPSRGRTRVPRLLGLAPGDAAAIVRGHGLRPVVERVADLRARPRVVGQSPGSGAARSVGAAVTLFVSR